jgi:hypothetical protein
MKTILSLDGGGVRGVIATAFLETIEKKLELQRDERLVDRFDLVGGTSTGAIVAGAVALGFSAPEITDYYRNLAPKIFKRSAMRIPGLQSLFDAKQLSLELASFFGNRRLDSADLKTGFALVLKRLDTGSPWILSNNPGSKYWDDPADRSYVGNKNYTLANLIRASTAAPHYFQPESIEIIKGQPPGLFVDGGVTPYNNPALALLQLATIPAHGYEWPVGAPNLRIISIGTGSYRERLDPTKASKTPAVGLAIKALAGIISDAQVQTLALMQLLGNSRVNWEINSEIGDLADVQLTPEPMFDFVRYDVRLEQNWLFEKTGQKFSQSEVQKLQQMDNPEMIKQTYEIGLEIAKSMVKAEHFLPAQDS